MCTCHFGLVWKGQLIKTREDISWGDQRKARDEKTNQWIWKHSASHVYKGVHLILYILSICLALQFVGSLTFGVPFDPVGRRERHRDRGRCQHAAGRRGAAGSSSGHQSCKSSGVPAGDQPADVPTGAVHGAGEQRSVPGVLSTHTPFLWGRREKMLRRSLKKYSNDTLKWYTTSGSICVSFHQLWLLWSSKAPLIDHLDHLKFYAHQTFFWNTQMFQMEQTFAPKSLKWILLQRRRKKTSVKVSLETSLTTSAFFIHFLVSHLRAQHVPNINMLGQNMTSLSILLHKPVEPSPLWPSLPIG